MILSQYTQQYFREIVSKVATCAGEQSSKTPYIRHWKKLVLLVKKCHPHSSHTEILRVAQALPLTKELATPVLITDILNPHGYGYANMNTDPAFWTRIQRTIEEVERASGLMVTGRDIKRRKETFFIDK
jgi:hypothetical protein